MNSKALPVPNHNRGVVYAIISALALSIMALFVKLAAPNTTNSMTIMFRFSVSFIYILIVLGFYYCRGKKFPLKAHKPSMQFIRASIAVLSMMLFYYSLKFIPLIDGTALTMTNPLFIPLLGFFFLHQKMSWKICMMVVVGFVGILLILQPGFEVFNIKSLYALAAGLTSAIVILQLKSLSKYDQPYTTMLYYFTIAFVLSALLSIHNWVKPDLHTCILLLGVGIFGTIYQAFLIRASWHASAIAVSCSLYMAIIFSGLLDWLFWHKIPDLLSLLGMAVVVISAYCITKAPKK